MDSHPLLAFIRMIGDMVLKRGSVFNPLLKLNGTVIAGSYLVYLKANTLWVFVPCLVVLTYSLYRHEFFALKMPHMLASENVQKLGMQIAAGPMGQKGEEKEEREIELLPSVIEGEKIAAKNPKRKEIK